MSKPAVGYFSVTYGLQGCYLPDSDAGAYRVTRRKDLLETFRDICRMYDVPEYRLRDVRWMRVWHHIKQHDASSLHFCIATDKHNMLEFHGMTEAEYEERQKLEE